MSGLLRWPTCGKVEFHTGVVDTGAVDTGAVARKRALRSGRNDASFFPYKPRSLLIATNRGPAQYIG
uniref:Uncharacterized protein n=1 Tax=Anguilla anguilla TaxID=7936 RepID=A0A0E9Q3P7_ANGAN